MLKDTLIKLSIADKIFDLIIKLPEILEAIIEIQEMAVSIFS